MESQRVTQDELLAAPAGLSAQCRAAKLVLAGLVLLGILLRLHPVGSAYLFGDEMLSLGLLSLPYGDLVGLYTDALPGLALPLLQKASADLFGWSLLTLRLPSLLPALATLLLVAISGHRVVSCHATVFATALLATSTMHIFYARFARSYALVALLAYVFVANLTRILAEHRPSARRYVAAGIAGGLLPWAHALTIPFAGVTGAAAVVAVLAQRRGRALPLLVTLGASAALALLLYYPAWESAMEQYSRALQRSGTIEPGPFAGPFEPLDVATIFAGSRIGAYMLFIAVPLAALQSMRRHGLSRLPLVVSALTPLPLLYAVGKFGSYGYARYAIPALPAVVLLLGELIATVVHRLSRNPDRASPAFAVLVALGLCAAGPWRMVDDGPFANSYLSLVPLPAFDAPFPAIPDFYSKFEPGATIIEVPTLPNRARHLYRNYYLQHRHPTLLGLLPDEADIHLPGPYVTLDPPSHLERRADYLVIHLDAVNESSAYFEFAQNEGASGASSLRTLVRLQNRFPQLGTLPAPSKALIATLTADYGAPVVDDGRFLVYRLRAGVPPGTGERSSDRSERRK